jgi:carbamate kinase
LFEAAKDISIDLGNSPQVRLIQVQSDNTTTVKVMHEIPLDITARTARGRLVTLCAERSERFAPNHDSFLL